MFKEEEIPDSMRRADNKEVRGLILILLCFHGDQRMST
jgi:hypothetical protein